ncbi:MAG: hypothetical protein ACJ8FY_27180 [Gemmataceae bacterium]
MNGLAGLSDLLLRLEQIDLATDGLPDQGWPEMISFRAHSSTAEQGTHKANRIFGQIAANAVFYAVKSTFQPDQESLNKHQKALLAGVMTPGSKGKVLLKRYTQNPCFFILSAVSG